ncbi:replication initiator [Microbispora sp. NPDC049633]|uniref:replication initiator n=1 Tax=Microbispora sp. NPDC049633 TaxID=3154355 RepID=UPI00342E6DCC
MGQRAPAPRAAPAPAERAGDRRIPVSACSAAVPPRRNNPVCEHSRPEGCGGRHADDNCQVGQTICVDCCDYRGAVLWNAQAGELWRRFTQALPATFARYLGISRAELSGAGPGPLARRDPPRRTGRSVRRTG